MARGARICPMLRMVPSPERPRSPPLHAIARHFLRPPLAHDAVLGRCLDFPIGRRNPRPQGDNAMHGFRVQFRLLVAAMFVAVTPPARADDLSGSNWTVLVSEECQLSQIGKIEL